MDAGEEKGRIIIFDLCARYRDEAITTSPAMTVPKPGKAQACIVKFEDEDGVSLHGGGNYVIHINGPVSAEGRQARL